MNRFELFLALVLLFVLAVYTLRTKWFDRFMNWVLDKSAPKSDNTDKNQQ